MSFKNYQPEFDETAYWNIFYVIDLDKSMIAGRINVENVEELQTEWADIKKMFPGRNLELVQAIQT